MDTIQISQHPSYPDRFEIFVGGEKWKDVHRTIFGKTPKIPTINESISWENAFQAWEYQRAKGYIIWRLSSQSYHSEQLGRMLKERLVSQETVDALIHECLQNHLLDDDGWLRSFINSHEKRFGKRMLIQKLRQKGLSAEALESISFGDKDEEGTIERICHLLATRYRNKDLTNFKEKQKVIASLARKGFEFGHIQAAIATCLQIL